MKGKKCTQCNNIAYYTELCTKCKMIGIVKFVGPVFSDDKNDKIDPAGINIDKLKSKE